MSGETVRRSSRKRGQKRPPVKLTVKILAPEKKKLIISEPDLREYESEETSEPDEESKMEADAEVESESEAAVETENESISDAETETKEAKGDMEDHDYAAAECDYCSKSFGDRGKLLKHIRKRHLNGSLFCMCHGREFKSKRTKEMHEQKARYGTLGMRKNYRRYTPEMLMRAYQAVKEDKMSTRHAARHYGVPFTTLLDRVSGRLQIGTFRSSSGPPPLIKREDEEKLCNHIQFMAAIGYSYLRSSIIQLATDLAVFKGALEEGKTLSDNWYRKFIKRWPKMAKKPQEEYPENPEVVKKYFEEYVHVLKSHGLLTTPEHIYCLTVYEVNIQKLDQSSKKSSSKPNDIVSIIMCCNASGETMSPFMVFSGGTSLDNLLDGCLPNTQARVSMTGEVDSQIFKDYFRNHLLKLLEDEQETDQPVIVLYNGHLIHFEMERIEWAKKHGVLLFALPPQMKPVKASLDSTVRDLFHNIFKQEAKKYKKRHSGDPLTKFNVSHIVGKVFPQVFASRTLVRFFKNSGVYPVGPELVNADVAYGDVHSVNEAVYDDLDSTDAFLDVRLPFPTVAKRVMKRRNEIPFEPLTTLNLVSQGQPEQMLPKKKLVKEEIVSDQSSHPRTFGATSKEYSHPKTFGNSVEDNSYVHGIRESSDNNEVEVVSVAPTIDLPECNGAFSEINQHSQTIDSVVGEVVCETTEAVPVVETQEVSSVVEVGTSEASPVVVQLSSGEVAEGTIIEEPTAIEVAVPQADDVEKCTYVIDPATNIRYKIMFTFK